MRKILRQKQPQAYVAGEAGERAPGPVSGLHPAAAGGGGLLRPGDLRGAPGPGLPGQLPDGQALRQPAAEGSGDRGHGPVRDAAGAPRPGRLGPVLDDHRGQEGQGPSVRPDPGLQPADVRRGHGGREDAGLPAVPRGGLRVPGRRAARDRLRQPEVGRARAGTSRARASSGTRSSGTSAGYYGFRPAPHRPYRPQTKGKVESGVKYVKRFLRGKEFTSLDDLNARLLEWIVTVADQRVHGTTHRKPAEMFLEEKDLLLSVEGPPGLCHRGALDAVCPQGLPGRLPDQPLLGALPPGRQARRGPDRRRDDQDLPLRASSSPAIRGSRAPTGRRSTSRITVGLIKAAKPAAAPPDDVEVRDLAVYERLAEGGVL